MGDDGCRMNSVEVAVDPNKIEKISNQFPQFSNESIIRSLKENNNEVNLAIISLLITEKKNKNHECKNEMAKTNEQKSLFAQISKKENDDLKLIRKPKQSKFNLKSDFEDNENIKEFSWKDIYTYYEEPIIDVDEKYSNEIEINIERKEKRKKRRLRNFTMKQRLLSDFWNDDEDISETEIDTVLID